MSYLPQAIFTLFLIAAGWFFARNVGRIRRNISIGRDVDRSDQPKRRWAIMARVALGQGKMVARPVAGILHILVYVGFVVINIEVMEIVLDGLFGTHRLFAFIGPLYNALIWTFEWLAILVLVGCVIFLIRRNVLRIKRFWSKEMVKWPRSDANIILIAEILLMMAFLMMNAADEVLQGYSMKVTYIKQAGSFPVSTFLFGFFEDIGMVKLVWIERGAWWFHIVGILAFLNYLPYSKHFHILLAFPNTYYANLDPKGRIENMEAVTNEVKLMMDPSADPYATPAPDAAPPERFGAKDVFDLTWKNLMDAYSCTECGRCTSECPANQTGKLLSPRKIMMDTRDRLEEVGKNIDKNGEFQDDGMSLIGGNISNEELWACTTCNACTEACPINIDPLDIILQGRRYLVMEESNSPSELNGMFTNIENNGAPWQFAQADRLNWATED